jgi:hypothetical protein
MKIYIVTVQDDCGCLHVIEAFTNEAKALEYNVEMGKIYNNSEQDWTIGYTIRVLDEENLGLTGIKEHYEKRDSKEWCARFNTLK